MNAATNNPILSTYKERFPWHAFAADQKGPLRMYATIEALKYALVQHNQKHSISWLVYDVDSNTATTDWLDAGAPIPNILVVNPQNGHAHLFYGLEVPVHNYEGASEKALRYLAAIDVALTKKLGADPGYNKLISKNPFHNRWVAVVPNQELYTLDKLARGLDLSKLLDGRRKQPAVGYGRNCNLFHDLRRWAYSERRKAQLYLSYDMFREAITWRGYALNAQFTPPLPATEVRATAKSVAKWTWKSMSPEGFREWQRRKSIAGNRVKQLKARQLEQNILQAVKECPQLSQGDIATMLGIQRETVNRHLSRLKCESKSSLSDIGKVTPGSSLSDIGNATPGGT